jgi:O-antigen/teichoic acid export membrane protein
MFLGFGILGIKVTGDINGALSGRLLASLFGFFGAAALTIPDIKFIIAWKYLKRILNYGLPLIPANLSSYILISSDRYILNATSTLSIVAIYSFVYKLSSLLDVVVNRPFATDWAARRYKLATQDNAPKKFSDVLTIYFYISSIAVLVIFACSPLIYNLIAPLTYIDGLKVLPILLFALQIYGLSYPLNVGLVIKDKTFTVAKIGIFSAIFCISVELWLIPKFGMIGAAWSTFLSYAVWTTAITVFSLKIYPIHYDLRKISLIGLTTTLGYIGLYVNSQFIPDVTIIGSLLISLLWLAGVYGITGFLLIKKNPY